MDKITDMEMDHSSSFERALWVEVQIGDGRAKQGAAFAFTRARKVIEEQLRNHTEWLQVGQEVDLREVDTPEYRVDIEAVHVFGHTGPPQLRDIYRLSENKVKIYHWNLNAPVHEPELSEDGTMTLYAIPSEELARAWKVLIFENNFHFRVLLYMVRMIQLMRSPAVPGHDPFVNWNRLCLFYGPPGCGKTTLCRALSQKLGLIFGGRDMLRVDCNTLLSKYFGESAKLVNSVFAQVKAQAVRDHRLLVVVLEEVESIAGSRARLSSGTENYDGVRATNALLKMLDDLRGYNNLIIICTTNMISALDDAFLDRVDLKQLVPLPPPRIIYDLLRSALNSLAENHLIRPDLDPAISELVGPEDTSANEVIPAWDVMDGLHFTQPSSNASRLWDLAQKCNGLSGRTIRRLPLACLGMHTWTGETTMADSITMLVAAAEQEITAPGSSGIKGCQP